MEICSYVANVTAIEINESLAWHKCIIITYIHICEIYTAYMSDIYIYKFIVITCDVMCI